MIEGGSRKMGDNDGNRRRLSIGIPCLLLVLSWTTVALRVWVKKWVVNAFSLDDWFMVVGMVCLEALNIAAKTSHERRNL